MLQGSPLQLTSARTSLNPTPTALSPTVLSPTSAGRPLLSAPLSPSGAGGIRQVQQTVPVGSYKLPTASAVTRVSTGSAPSAPLTLAGRPGTTLQAGSTSLRASVPTGSAVVLGRRQLSPAPQLQTRQASGTTQLAARPAVAAAAPVATAAAAAVATAATAPVAAAAAPAPGAAAAAALAVVPVAAPVAASAPAPAEVVKVQEVRLREPTFLPQRLPKPHEYFPFDLFSGRAADGLLPADMMNEMMYVRDHCMIPPYPWGQVIYHDFVVQNVLPNVPGHFAELGMGQGGTSIFFARLAKRHGRKFLAVDSFEGLPPPDTGKDNPYFLIGDYRPPEGGDNYDNFMKYMEKFDVDDTLHCVKAFFKDLEVPPEFDKFAFVHLDSDLYDSVYDSLEKMWPLLSEGGCIAVDDFFHHAQGPARAVSDFFRTQAADAGPPLLFVVPTYAVLIVKGRSACLGWQEDGDGKKVPIMYSPRALDGNFYSFALARNCQPFVKAAETSLERLEEAIAKAKEQGAAPGGLVRARTNAEMFLEFLRYSDSEPRSGIDILRYLQPLEDMFDITQGNLCGMSDVTRKTIEIGI